MQTNKHRILLKCQSNIASKQAPGMHGCTMTENKHLTTLKAAELRSLVHCGSIEPRYIRTSFACKSYLSMLTEPPIKLRQRDVALTLVILNKA